MLAPSLVATRIDFPQRRRRLQLSADDADQRRRRCLIHAKGSAGMTQIAQLDSNAEAVVIAAMLADERAIGPGQGIAADQLAFLGWEGEQLLALRGGEQLAAWHRLSPLNFTSIRPRLCHRKAA